MRIRSDASRGAFIQPPFDIDTLLAQILADAFSDVMPDQKKKLSGTKRPQTPGGEWFHPEGKNLPQPPNTFSQFKCCWSQVFDAFIELMRLMGTACRIFQCNQTARKLYGRDMVSRHRPDAICNASKLVSGCPFPGIGRSCRRGSAELRLDCAGIKRRWIQYSRTREKLLVPCMS